MRTAIAIPARFPAAQLVERAAFASVAAAFGLNGITRPEDVAARLWRDDKVIAVLNARAAVDPAKASQAGWAAELVTDAYRQFLGSLQPASAASRLITLGMPAELNGFGEAQYPARSGAPVIVGWVAEGGAIPVAARGMRMVTLGPPKKVALLTVVTHELMARTDAESVFTTVLREDCAATLDAAYFSTGAASASAHAGLLNGVSPLMASGDGGEHAAAQDLGALAEAVADGGSGQVVFIVSAKRAASFPIFFPELSKNVTILASAALPNDRVVAVDPVALIHSVDTAPEITASKHTAIQMETAPVNLSAAGSPNVVAAPIASMFQSGQIALRIISAMTFAKRTANAVAYMDAVEWSAAS